MNLLILDVAREPSSRGGLALVAIVIVVIALAAFLILALGIFLIWRKRRQARRDQSFGQVGSVQSGSVQNSPNQ